jgi:predicted nucleic acid-binding protein
LHIWGRPLTESAFDECESSWNLNEGQAIPGNDDPELPGRPVKSRSPGGRTPANHGDWWESRRSAFELYISELVVQEVKAGDAFLAKQRLDLLADIPILTGGSEILRLAEDLITEGPIPRKAAGDAVHIAMATVYGCEYLLTWNCRHIANAELHRAIKQVVERAGYELPILCTPEELMGEEQ